MGDTRGHTSAELDLSWDHDNKVGRIITAAALFATTFALLPATDAGADSTAMPKAPTPSSVIEVIVQESIAADDTAENLIEQLGGVVTQHLDIIGGFVATLPTAATADLATHPAVKAVTPNGSIQLMASGYKANKDDGSLLNVAKAIGADDLWKRGITGAGVDVALIDSGVVPVEGLTTPGKVINGPDLSFESEAANLRYLDSFGHGTHMAGIIAGRDSEVSRPDKDAKRHFVGIAPDSRVVSIKVADAAGRVDVSQVIAAIDWVVQHKADNGMSIRVLNLSFGTDGVQEYELDPLAYAVEVAWDRGIVVVVAAGNNGESGQLANPATNPFVITVGAVDQGRSFKSNDDAVATFSACGTDARHVDVLAPGKSVVSLRAPGSTADLSSPGAMVARRYFTGSGTSQAAAAVSGAAALLISDRPSLSPDEVKALLMKNARPMKDANDWCQGAGTIDLNKSLMAEPGDSRQRHGKSSGTGSLDAARGSASLVSNSEALNVESDAFGITWDGASWSQAAWTGASWSGGSWSGASWSGASWSGGSWSGASWSGASWSGASWSGGSWSGGSWSGGSWSGGSWSGGSWSSFAWE
jgi:serine protease AprX